MKINPYYNPDKVNLETLSFDQPNLSYEYNTLCFWITGNGEVYSASDSGCSCPTPFENYSGENQKEILQQLERVGSLEQAEQIFDSWNQDYMGKPFLPSEKKAELRGLFPQTLKRNQKR